VQPGLADRAEPIVADLGMTGTMSLNTSCTSPAIAAWMLGTPPRYGTCVIEMPACLFKVASDRCAVEPLPDVPALSWPGLVLASAISSLSVLTGRFGLAARTSGFSPARMIGSKSRSGS
jgi:hypothetical protein